MLIIFAIVIIFTIYKLYLRRIVKKLYRIQSLKYLLFQLITPKKSRLGWVRSEWIGLDFQICSYLMGNTEGYAVKSFVENKIIWTERKTRSRFMRFKSTDCIKFEYNLLCEYNLFKEWNVTNLAMKVSE